MKRISLLISIAFLSCSLLAQNVKEDLKNNPGISGTTLMAYPTPTKALTPAPEGKQPFYISHYGRHGSRYLINRSDYHGTIETLEKANAVGKLTEKGKALMKDLVLLAEESESRYGELSPLGAQQHREIARRMFNNFPEVFEGNVCVDAKSTTVIRCVLSMENELQELYALNPQLRITHDASEHDMYYMNFNDKQLKDQRTNKACNDFYNNWKKKNIKPDHFLKTIFNDKDYIKKNINKEDFYYIIYKLASEVQNQEVRNQINIYNYLDEEDIYTQWQSSNIVWFIHYGPNSLNGAKQPFSQRNLVRNIIQQADSCITLPRPGATLRFGHDTMVLPLVCLLDLNGYGKTMHPKDIEANKWYNHKIFPMACNVQFIFYRSSPEDKDVWVKVLLNEEEATLPIEAVDGPYYRWSDVRKYYLDKINAFKY